MNTKSETLKIGFNAIGFQSAWWLSVLGIVMGYPFLGPLVMTLYLVADHYSFTKGKSGDTSATAGVGSSEVRQPVWCRPD